MDNQPAIFKKAYTHSVFIYLLTKFYKLLSFKNNIKSSPSDVLLYKN